MEIDITIIEYETTCTRTKYKTNNLCLINPRRYIHAYPPPRGGGPGRRPFYHDFSLSLIVKFRECFYYDWFTLFKIFNESFSSVFLTLSIAARFTSWTFIFTCKIFFFFWTYTHSYTPGHFVFYHSSIKKITFFFPRHICFLRPNNESSTK